MHHTNEFSSIDYTQSNLRTIVTMFFRFFLTLAVLSFVRSTVIDPDINLDDDQEHVNIIVTMKESNSPVLSQLTARSFPTREDRLNSVAKEAREFAAKSQENLLRFLTTDGQGRAETGQVEPQVQSLWISNQVSIQNVDVALVKALGTRPDIHKIQLEHPIRITVPYDDHDGDDGDTPDGEDGPWGIEAMNVPAVWAKGIRGEGVVVANIDTGVRGTHEALSSNFLGEGGWLDLGNGTLKPYDVEGGHGTTTMSLMVGTAKNIGVAPGAKWMACQLNEDAVSARPNKSRLEEPKPWLSAVPCAQWLVCPGAFNPNMSDLDPGDAPNCGQVPHIVLHAWGNEFGRGDFFDKVVEYYHAAGIIPVFSGGNYLPDCCGADYPGILPDVLAVGATRKDRTVWYYSSRGPSAREFELIKPDLVAPGVLVRHAGETSDTAYRRASGTSLSSPYTAGVVALMLSKNPNLNFNQVREILLASTVAIVSTGESCGTPDDEYPNNIAGHGLIDANKAIEYMDRMNINED